MDSFYSNYKDTENKSNQPEKIVFLSGQKHFLFTKELTLKYAKYTDFGKTAPHNPFFSAVLFTKIMLHVTNEAL